MRAPLPGVPLSNPRWMPMEQAYTDEGINGLSTNTFRLFRSDNTLDITTDIANIRTFLKSVVQNLSSSIGNDKYDSTFETDFINYVVYWYMLITQLRAMNTQQAVVPSLTRGDATAGLTLTRDSMIALLAQLEQTKSMLVPGLALAISYFYTQTFQLTGAVLGEGKKACYFMPISPSYTLANIETLLTSIYGVAETAAVHAYRNKIPMIPFSRVLTAPLPPLPLYSTHGIFMAYMIPSSDDANKSYACGLATSDVVWLHSLGIGESWEAAVLYRCQDDANSPMFLSALALAAANKINIKYAQVGETSFTAYGDTNYLMDWIYSVTQINNHVAQFNNSNCVTRVRGYDNPLSVTGWNNHAIAYLTRHANGSPPAIRSLGLLPDSIVAIASGSRSSESATPGAGPANVPGGNLPIPGADGLTPNQVVDNLQLNNPLAWFERGPNPGNTNPDGSPKLQDPGAPAQPGFWDYAARFWTGYWPS